MRKHCVVTTEMFVGLLLSDHKWFKTTKKRLNDRSDHLDRIDHKGFLIPEGYFLYDWERHAWYVDENVFPEVSEIVELDDSDDVYITTFSNEAALRYKLMLG